MCIDLMDDNPNKEDSIVTTAKKYVEDNKRNNNEEKRDTTITHANDNLNYGKVFVNTFGNEGKPAVTAWNFKVISKWDSTYFRIFVNDILHCSFQHKKFSGMQTWMDGEKVIKYCVEISLENTPPILLEYDMPEKWKVIINELDKHQHLF